ncbi:GldG family protein [Qipengyuania xiapuensis]|uniref:GldG family protein n=1 Tax=Qipengyuania xiapuensis TaxID=2867236 RepID=A0ABX8ZT44_9SPHN|nr:GldG family protein [Qipengyuania xiapuensis]QZD92177.1 GldG family protein [Qipengyuania xiapuensis]
MPTSPRASVLAISLGLLLAACNAAPEASGDLGGGESGPTLGLFSTLPIYWGEGADISSMIDGESQPGWVRAQLEEDRTLTPLDTLEADALEGLEEVVLAQPRPLAPSENVAFDAWLRAGGKALIFADPVLTQHSEFAIGDPRRPHDMVLISPLLTRWGLELKFDDAQSEGQREAAFGQVDVPVELAGEFESSGDDPKAQCTIAESGIAARCSVGEGEVLLIADAALLDDHYDTPERREALAALTASIFGE